FRAYKIGSNIGASMQPSDTFRYKYIMEKDGELLEFDEYPTDPGLEFKDMVLLNPEAQPKITDYNVWNEDGDFTEESLKGRKLFLVVQDVNQAELDNMDKTKKLVGSLQDEMDIWLLTSNDAATIENFRHEFQL